MPHPDEARSLAVAAVEQALLTPPGYPTQPGAFVDGQKWQNFVLWFQNTAGTIQHAIYDNPLDAQPAYYADRINGQTSALTNTPTTVGAGVPLAAGVGLLNAANYAIILDTIAQDVARSNVQAQVCYYDGNVQRTRAIIGIINRNVNGVTIPRVELRLYDDLNGAGTAAPIGAVLLPAGKAIGINIWGYIR